MRSVLALKGMEDVAVVPGTGEYGRIGGRERLFKTSPLFRVQVNTAVSAAVSGSSTSSSAAADAGKEKSIIKNKTENQKECFMELPIIK